LTKNPCLKHHFALVRRALTATIIIALSGWTAPLAMAQAPSPGTASQLPNLGDGSDLTPSNERRMGDRIARELYRDPDYIDDAVLGDYVQGIWQPLLAAARLRGELNAELDERFVWEILMGRDRTVNAFALPGGYFGLHLGLLAVVNSRDELASVLGHELSHVTQRHISRLISKQGAQTPWLIGAMILGALAASKNPNAANALIVGGQAVAAQNQLNFSRDMEREADRIGFGVMTQAGFEPQGFVTMFDKLAAASRLNDSGSFPYLRSHPLTTERIADMQARLPQGAAKTPSPVQTLEHAMLAARARVLSDASVDALRAWAHLANPAGASGFSALDAPRQAGILYGAAMAAQRLRDAGAVAALQGRLDLLTRGDAPAARLSRLLAAELALAADDPRKALAALRPAAAPAADPANLRPELLLTTQAQIRTGLAKDAAQSLQAWLVTHPRDAQAWQLLSSAQAALGQPLGAIRADAESRVAQLDYASAQDRFKAGQELARELARSGRAKGTADDIEAAILDTRSRQNGLLLREQALER
jgi:predicted Zn-dependent protease